MICRTNRISSRERNTGDVKSDKKNVIVRDGSEKVETGIKKFGAMIGDYVEVSCNQKWKY